MAAMPETVQFKLQFDEDTIGMIRQLIREEIAMYAANSLTAAVDRRDGTEGGHRAGGMTSDGEYIRMIERDEAEHAATEVTYYDDQWNVID